LLELEREFDRLKRDLSFSKDEINRLSRELSEKLGLEEDIRILKQRNFDQKLKMGEMTSFNSHLKKFNDMLKSNEHELRRKLRAYDLALSSKMNQPVNINTSPERRKFMAEYIVPDLNNAVPGDKTQAMEQITKHYSRSMDNSPAKRRGRNNVPYAGVPTSKDPIFDKYLNNKYQNMGQ
jgi:hypothetical protein